MIAALAIFVVVVHVVAMAYLRVRTGRWLP
jgi:hypothetical protein